MSQTRLIFVLFFMAGLWGAVMIRGAYLQLIPNPQFQKIKDRQFNRMIKLSSRRGDIFDRNGKALAVSVTSYSLFADPKIIKDPYTTAKKLARHFKWPFQSIYQKIRHREKRFVWLKRRLDQKHYQTIKNWKIRGLAFKEEYKRVYPHQNLASQVMGFVGQEQQGVEGIEKKFEHILSGDEKKMSVQRDARGRALIEDGRFLVSRPAGSDIYLTIDKDLQYWVEDQLEKAVKKNGAKSAWAVVLDPENSEILAMGSYPSFNGNRPQESPLEHRRNKTIHDVHETGSVMKAFSVAGALERGIVEPNTKINTENGVFRIGKRTIKEADRDHAFKELTVSEIIAHSSNVGTAKIGLQMTDRGLHEVLLDFGFGARTGVELEGEAKGIMRSPPWGDHLTASVSFGHGVAVTALQVANAYGAIANGGWLHRPSIIKGIGDVEKGEIIPIEKKRIRAVLSSKNAHLMKLMLSSVVTQGRSGYKARLHGYPVAGKTGTAQKVNPHGRGYLPGHYLSSFAGFVPANDPQYVIYVAVDSPQKNGYYATTVAAPLFRHIAEFALRKKGTTPVYMSDQNLVKQGPIGLEKNKRETAETKKQTGKMKVSIDHIPDQLKSLHRVPRLTGLSLREVYSRLNGLDLKVTIHGRGQVVKTWPEQGKSLGPQLKVILREESFPSLSKDGSEFFKKTRL